ncbi:hypothetical protein BVER_01122 [Candidatus Burkholderia verschuerenii]|uniref:Lysozyme inhibitor LprI-like N-terminal domain-containing protein n=1 Tax=Candidatus Burkholderia verschuerenii TaxID=242163 RepID=A0A0L0MBA8_9BURK|nr:lysozyme inhibitor LprI family protein [Candidatus Burkholderia verschuerenii]KND59259.1 hypothetical protein BVER_01122 [Candidatus Burkholderia verschuerenii]
MIPTMMRSIAGFGALFVVSISLAATDSGSSNQLAIRAQCAASSQAAMKQCLEKRVGDSENKLREAEDAASTTLSRWDEDPPYVRKAISTLDESKQTYLEYRKSQCEFAASLSGGAASNAREFRRLACIAAMNDRRAETLRNAISDVSLK